MTAMRQLFSVPRRPYYIDAPAYRRTSAGIRVLHLLCHALNSIGEEAYLYPTETNPALNTPLVTPELIERHKAASREPIVVYPEVVPGNPRKAASVVRYVLNRAGLLGGDSVYADTELIFGFGLNALPDGAAPQNILFLPPIDTAIFNNQDNPYDHQRSGTLLYPGRHQAALSQYPQLAAEATLITYSWPESHEALAELLRRSEVVYCFESTAIAAEAALCGCPAVILPSPFFNGVALSEAEIGRNGIALNDSPEEVAFAQRTVGKMWDAYQAAETRFWSQLDHFVATTQAMPVSDVSAQPAEDPAAAEARRIYAVWRKRQSLQEIDAQLLAERMVLKWAQRPGLHLLLAVHPGEESLLADTLDSLAAQLYPEWMLTVVTVLPTPEGLGDIPNLQWLSVRDPAHIDYVIDEMAAASPGTWLARIEPGVTLEPHALQVIADYINHRPDWRLIYCDEDTRDGDGSYNQPLFKPDFNLDLLRAQAYFGCLVFVEKQSFLAAGRYGQHSGAENYDLSLRTLDHAGEAAIGHISQMLAHLPRSRAAPCNPRPSGPRWPTTWRAAASTPSSMMAPCSAPAASNTAGARRHWSASSSRPATGRSTCAHSSRASPPAPATLTTKWWWWTMTAPTRTPSSSWRSSATPPPGPTGPASSPAPAPSATPWVPTPEPPPPGATTCCSSTTTPT